MTVLRIDLPVLAPAITGVLILSFVVGLEYFDVPLLLGTPVGIRVFSTQIYALITDQTPADYGAASALALLLVAIVIALVAAQWRILGTRRYTTVTGKSYRQDRWDIGRWRWAGTAFIVVYVVLAIVAPLGQLLVGSLQPFFGGTGDYSLVNYRWLVENPTTLTALRNTLVVALGAVAGTAGLAMRMPPAANYQAM
jgi:iron(III) transport system permease protein